MNSTPASMPVPGCWYTYRPKQLDTPLHLPNDPTVVDVLHGDGLGGVQPAQVNPLLQLAQVERLQLCGKSPLLQHISLREPTVDGCLPTLEPQPDATPSALALVPTTRGLAHARAWAPTHALQLRQAGIQLYREQGL
jgi:hypothetical protein